LADHEPLLAAYREKADPDEALMVMKDLAHSTQTEQHALELEAHLHTKLSGSAEQERTSFLDLAARTELWEASVQRVSLDLHAELVRKQFLVYAPDEEQRDRIVSRLADAFRGAHGVLIDIEWSTSRHATRTELAPFAYHARLTATPFTLHGDAGEESAPQREDRATFRVIDVDENDQSRVDAEALLQLHHTFAGAAVSRAQWAWFLAFVCTHPTDLGFDVLSECLQRRPQSQL